MDNKEKIYLKRLHNICKKNIKNIIFILCIFISLGFFYSYNMVTPKYKSISSIVLTSDNINQKESSVTQSDLTLNKNLISTYGKIIKSSKVINKVINNLNLNISEHELYKNINIQEVSDTQIIQIEVTNKNPEEAQKIAKELDAVFIEEIKQIYKVNNITVIDEASLENIPYNVNHMVDILVFIGIGIICCIGMIFVIYFFDTTVKFKEDIEEYIGLNVIGVVPINKQKINEELIVQNDGKSIISEAFKTIRTNLSFTKSEQQSRAFLFTSCNASEGKSWITANIAVAYAISNKNVILVDSDMRKGRQHNIFNVPNKKGLSECLKNIRGKDDYQTLENYIQETNIPKVHIITIGAIPPNPSELLSSNKLNDLIYMLKCVYDIVIIDGTPCNLVSDSISVSRVADSTILVAESRGTKIEDLQNTVKLIRNVGGNLENAILNKKDIKGKEYKKGYYYGEPNQTSKIEIKSHTVRELIENRTDYIEDEINLTEEYIQNDQMSIITEKIENLQNEILKIPDINTENYKKVVEDVKKIYDKEIDKIKLFESIKENIIKNGLEEKIDNLNYSEDIKVLVNRLNSLETAINNDRTEKIETILNNLKEEQYEQLKTIDFDIKKFLDEKISKLNYSEEIDNLVMKLKKVEEAIASNNSNKEIQNMIYELKEEQNQKLQRLDNHEILFNLQNKLENMQINNNYKLNELKVDNKKDLEEMKASYEEILNEIKEAQDRNSSNIQSFQNKKFIENSFAIRNITDKLGEILANQNIKVVPQIEELLEKKIRDLKYEENTKSLVSKLNQIEEAINNNVRLEEVGKMLDELRKEQTQKIQELDNQDLLIQLQNKLENLQIEQQDNLNIQREELERIQINYNAELQQIKDMQYSNLADMQGYQNTKFMENRTEIKNILEKLGELENNQNMNAVLKTNELETQIQTMIDELKEEQNQKLQDLDNTDVLTELQNSLENIQNNQQDKLDEIKIIQNDTLEKILLDQENKLNEIKVTQKDELARIKSNNDKQIEEIKSNLQNYQNEKFAEANLEIKMVLEKLSEIQAIQNEKLEKIIKAQDKKLKSFEKSQDEKIEKFDNTAQVKELIKELKKMTTKYEKLEAKLKEKDEIINKYQKIEPTKKTSKSKSNVIELDKIKEKLSSEELVFKQDQEITYEQLVDYAIEIYDIDPETYDLKRRVK